MAARLASVFRKHHTVATMAWWFQRRRYYGPRRTSCWRNPALVFILTFVALASLRLRSKRWSLKKSVSSGASTKKNMMPLSSTIQYRQIEQGINKGSSSFVKYVAVNDQGQPVSFHSWAERIMMASDDDAVQLSFSNLLASLPYKALFFETPPTTIESSKEKQFEFVVVDAPELHAFAEHRPSRAFDLQFAACSHRSVCAFASLGGDARLIAPKPISPNTNAYTHLATFLRQAPKDQMVELWKLAASEYLAALKDRGKQQPTWLSTSGMGVAWLHLRLDTRPKYYTYDKYKEWSLQ